MTIRIDVPGVGQIVAENAATESTLRELVRVLGGNARGASGGRQAPQSRRNEGVFDNIVKAGKSLIDATNKLSKATLQVVQDFSNLGDSISSAANVTASALNKIPIVGELLGAAFQATAGAAENLARTFQQATSAGADFGGSVNEMARSASSAGMTIDQFAGLISNNSASLLAFGNNTSAGAKRFSELSRGIRESSSDLLALGLNTQDINEGLLNYGNLLRITGRNQNRSNAELIKGSSAYLREMDQLAKITGESRKDKEKEREEMLQDIQFQAFARTLSEDSQKELQTLIQSYPKKLQGFVKDLLYSGTLTREENQRQAHALGGTVDTVLGLREKMITNQRISDQARQEALMATRRDTEEFLDSNGTALASNRAYAEQNQAITAGMEINKNGVLDAAEAQNKAIASTDKFNEQVVKAQQALAGISNTFKEALANSGLLPKLMDFFGMLSNIVIKYVLPAFTNYLVPAVETITDFLIGLLVPAFEVLEEIISDLVPDIGNGFGFLDRMLDAVSQALSDMGVPLKGFYDKVVKGSGIMDTLSNAFKTVGDIFIGSIEFFGKLFGNIVNQLSEWGSKIIDVGKKTDWLTSGLGMAGNAIDDFVDFVKTILSREGADLVTMAIAEFFNVVLPDIAHDLKDWFESFLLDLHLMLDKYSFGASGFFSGMTKEKIEEIKQEKIKANEQRELDKTIAKNKLEAKYNDIKFNQMQEQMRKKETKTSKKIYDQSAKMAGDTLKNTAKAISLNTTTSSGAIETLKQFAEQQGKTSNFKNADAAKEGIGEAAKEAVKESAKPGTAPQPNTGGGSVGTGSTLQTNNQTAPSASSNQLNTIMSELVDLMRQNNMQNRQMMSSIAALSGNLYEG